MIAATPHQKDWCRKLKNQKRKKINHHENHEENRTTERQNSQ